MFKKIEFKNKNPKIKEASFNIKRAEGFTLIELVASIFIVSIAIIGIFNALSVVIILTSDSSDRLTATYLAQEGMEIVRNIRDTNWLNMDKSIYSGGTYSWGDGLIDNAAQDSVDCVSIKCEADYKDRVLDRTDDYLYLNDDGFYVANDSSGTKTKFKRKIKVEPITDVDNDEQKKHILKITSQVSWDKKSTILSDSVSANLCCPGDTGCPAFVSNCIKNVGTLYNWYIAIVSVTGVVISDPLNDNPDNNITQIGVGQTDQLTAVISPNTATNKAVVWGSSDDTIATVDNNGLVTGVSTGDAIITVTTIDGGHTKSVTFSVVAAP